MKKANLVYRKPEFYIEENRYEDTKDMFLFLSHLMSKKYNTAESLTISDHGCAAGELTYHLQKVFTNSSITGYDVDVDLLEKAKTIMPNSNFILGSVLEKNTCLPRTSDISICIGVIQIFDNFEETIDNLLAWTKPGGSVYLHGLFNNFPLDVDIKYNHSSDRSNGIKERGWNLFSKESVSRYLEEQTNIEEYGFYDFEISVDLEMKEDKTHNFIRSWTMNDAFGKRIITNGLNLMQPHSILEIKLLEEE